MSITAQTIDAANQALGRVASQAAALLLGKNSVVKTTTKVAIINAKQIKLSMKKERGIHYVSYSGYPGGLKRERLENLIERRGMGEALKRAVWGMLPKNQTRSKLIKLLEITE